MQSPPLARWMHYPITTCFAALAVVGSLRYWGGADINRFMTGNDQWWLEPWRLVTPIFFHVNALHLIFNLCWLWVFGTKVEEEFGHGRTLALYLLLAVGSNTADEALSHGGIGLSGVNYGLFGLLWVLTSRDSRFRGVVDRQTIQWMVGWFFLCILLTITEVWKVANVAHGAGCILGAMLGWTIAARKIGPRLLRAAVLAITVILCVAGGTVARPFVNFTSEIGHDVAVRGYLALERGDNQRAVDLYERAVAIDARQSGWWHNLGVAYYRLNRTADARNAFAHEDALKSEMERQEAGSQEPTSGDKDKRQ
jgi:membrane associated rhomboid family serine protease